MTEPAPVPFAPDWDDVVGAGFCATSHDLSNAQAELMIRTAIAEYLDQLAATSAKEDE